MAIVAETKVADVKKLVTDAAAQTVAATAPAFAAAPRFVQDGAAKAHAAVETGVAQAGRAAEGMFKAAEQAAEFGRGNVEAVARATQLYVTGVQDLSRQTVAMVQGLTDQAMENVKALAAVRSLKEAADLQASFGRAAFERSLTEGAKIQEAALRLVEQTAAPLSARVTAAVETFARPLAA